MKNIAAGLCQGRHSIPGVEEYIFPTEVNPLDVDSLNEIASEWVRSHCDVHKGITSAANAAEYADYFGYVGTPLSLYVTGLTVALAAVIRACSEWGVPLTLYHYDRDSGEYYPQRIF